MDIATLSHGCLIILSGILNLIAAIKGGQKLAMGWRLVFAAIGILNVLAMFLFPENSEAFGTLPNLFIDVTGVLNIFVAANEKPLAGPFRFICLFVSMFVGFFGWILLVGSLS